MVGGNISDVFRLSVWEVSKSGRYIQLATKASTVWQDLDQAWPMETVPARHFSSGSMSSKLNRRARKAVVKPSRSSEYRYRELPTTRHRDLSVQTRLMLNRWIFSVNHNERLENW